MSCRCGGNRVRTVRCPSCSQAVLAYGITASGVCLACDTCAQENAARVRAVTMQQPPDAPARRDVGASGSAGMVVPSGSAAARPDASWAVVGGPRPTCLVNPRLTPGDEDLRPDCTRESLPGIKCAMCPQRLAFTSRSGKQTYCSAACRQRAYRQRYGAARRWTGRPRSTSEPPSGLAVFQVAAFRNAVWRHFEK
jgi:hypothetical protein